MCGTCSFSQKFLDKVIGKTVKGFECTDYDESSEVEIIFTDDSKLVITTNVDGSIADFRFYKYSKEISKWIYVGIGD